MKKVIFPALVAGLFAASCSKNETKTETPETAPTEQVENSTETAKISASGTFEGTIPCASCPGIQTKLTLNEKDKTFVLDSNYLDEKDGKFTTKGSFELSEDGEFITLKEEGNTDQPQVYYLTSDAVYLVEKVGDKTIKEQYKLSKK